MSFFVLSMRLFTREAAGIQKTARRSAGRFFFGWGGRDRTCDHGIKTRCLTAWLRPNLAPLYALYRAWPSAPQDTPAGVSRSSCGCPDRDAAIRDDQVASQFIEDDRAGVSRHMSLVVVQKLSQPRAPSTLAKYNSAAPPTPAPANAAPVPSAAASPTPPPVPAAPNTRQRDGRGRPYHEKSRRF